MEFTPITGLQIRINFYTNRGCVLEDVIISITILA